MLKGFKEDWKSALVLSAFCLIMLEVLTGATLLLVTAGLLSVVLGLKVTKLWRNLMALGIFASYWVTYGKIIDPEVGLNFLVSIIVLKILEKETVRDRYMIFFGLLLIISAGSLFERTLTYVFFFAGSFFLLVKDFYSYLGQKWRLRDVLRAMVFVGPFAFLLFFFVPRLLSPIPFQQNQSSPGEIGYTPDVNISQIESLGGNQSPVFQVVMDRRVDQGSLYWRGNTLSFNDGWNWTRMPQDDDEATFILGAKAQRGEVTQSFRMFGRSDYFFTLDHGRTLTMGKSHFELGAKRSLPQRRWQWVQRYQAISDPGTGITDEDPSKNYLQVPLSKRTKDFIAANFKGKTVAEVSRSIQTYFYQKKFSYSLTPGKSQNLNEFLERKIGLCSHYASAVALIFRVQGIPARLVSGFMGGAHNRFADFYIVSQNDAHVWVEAFSEGRWLRLDPTEWIAPDRVKLGGEAFMESAGIGAKKSSLIRLPGFVQDLRMWFGQWDFVFYQWIEEMDYYTQEALLLKFNVKRQWLFSLIPLIMVIFMLAYIWYLTKRRKTQDESPYQESWRLFYRVMKKRGVILSPLSVDESDALLRKTGDPKVLEVWDFLITGSFKTDGPGPRELLKKIKQLSR